jgi:hypothetical protein
MDSLASLAKLLRVSSDFNPEEGVVSFICVLSTLPQAFAGQTIQLRLGRRTLMAIKLPMRKGKQPLKFGPVIRRMDGLKKMTEFALTLRIDETGEVANVEETDGEFLEAASIKDAAHFFARVQVHFSRFQHGDLLVVGARAAYNNISDFYVRAAALTVQIHRLIEKTVEQLAVEDRTTVEEFLSQASAVVAEGEALIAATEEPDWRLVRWTTSLATVGANLALSVDNSVQARSLYRSAARNTPLVRLSAVSALNCINSCFLAGTMAAFAGDPTEARELLELGVTGYQICVAAQDVLQNVWVVGDLINAARASRQCFIALAKLNFLDNKNGDRINVETTVDLAEIDSPVAVMANAGLCRDYAADIRSISV